MARFRPLPSVIDFNQLLTAIAKMKEYSTVVSLYKAIRVSFSPNACSMSILVDLLAAYVQGCKMFEMIQKLVPMDRNKLWAEFLEKCYRAKTSSIHMRRQRMILLLTPYGLRRQRKPKRNLLTPVKYKGSSPLRAP
ncbi:hypothetical protein RHSIM_Rhsim02G0051800 [Rhododendron simsii]|uniref:Pentatricopeptide repeat-containing protein n=1 Tax=Rhododendron simsii TaxID=118357 RepID=A0A834HHP7_RHOSS|nr:hypothetical protein RHSIM_Rhsim02G0051800 [Rhododendron simsii]